MKKYYLVGEDIARREITAEEAREYAGDSDYRVIAEDDGKQETAAAQAAEYPAPDWEPFVFPPREGYRLTGYEIERSDYEGRSFPADSIPAEAVKTQWANRWEVQGVNPDIYEAIPVYEPITCEGVGACASCKRLTCSRRGAGVRCRNYKA
uniref:Uncharacterized protein n=1 Tax=Siphoviridae sp. ct8LX107 TaxID=2826169 RepID=A0A8S5QQD7_9CAUD|nr:MAG TPA: hypothetical protein [Siphoviridae sp. ct8LX107]